MEAVTSSGKAVVTLPAETQILIVREFDAPNTCCTARTPSRTSSSSGGAGSAARS